MIKHYALELDGKRIGYTEFEYADPPMGVVYGKIIFDHLTSPYKFFRSHCINNNIKINFEEPEEKLIDTTVIPQLKVLLGNGEVLKGWGAAVNGMDSDVFEIQFGGIASELMQTEFENHYNEYYGKQ